MNRASLSFGTTSSGLIYMYIQLESKEKGWWIEKKKRNNDQKFSKFDEYYKSTDPRISTSLKQKKHENHYTKA